MTARLAAAAPLPGVLADIAEAAGREAALEIALRFGGNPLRIPHPADISPGHPLAELVGLEAARAIAERCGGGSAVEIPLARKAVVVHLTGKGLSATEIAVRLGISRYTARRYRRFSPEKPHP